MARTGQTRHAGIQAVWLARIINQQAGGTVVAPWEVDGLPDEWVETITGVAVELPAMQQAQKRVRAWFEKARREHPNYGKIH